MSDTTRTKPPEIVKPLCMHHVVRNFIRPTSPTVTSTSAREIPKYRNASPVKLSLEPMNERSYRVSFKKNLLVPTTIDVNMPPEPESSPRLYISTDSGVKYRKGSVDSDGRLCSDGSPQFPMSPFQQSRKSSDGSTSHDEERREILGESPRSDIDDNPVQEVVQDVGKLLEQLPSTSSIYFLKGLLKNKNVESPKISPLTIPSVAPVDSAPVLKFTLPTTPSRESTPRIGHSAGQSDDWRGQISRLRQNYKPMAIHEEWRRIIMYNNCNIK
jgi:hypothetical protein